MSSGIHETIRVVKGKADLSVAAATGIEGIAVDTLGFDDCLVVMDTGTANTSIENIIVEECATSGGTFTAVTGAAFATVTTSLDDNAYVGRIYLGPRQRFLHIQFDVVGTAADVSFMFILSRATEMPVSQQNTLVFNVLT
jgi:hypothetical protein